MYCANFILTYNDCKVIVEPPLLKYPINMTCQYRGSFENEALENEDRSTKHPNLENEAP